MIIWGSAIGAHIFRARPAGTESEAMSERQRSAWIDASLIVLTCVVIAAYAASNPLNHDVSWYLVATRRWLDGATLYVDIIEINPPLSFYHVAASLLLVPLPDKEALIAGLAIFAAGSAWWSRSLIGRSGAAHPGWLLAASLAAMLIVPLPGFGQREQMLLIFALPYIWTLALRPKLGRREDVTIGAFAFLGFALKPYFLLIPALMTLSLAVSDRSWRPFFLPANLAIAILCPVYLAAAKLLHPAYFDQIIPMGALTYFAYGMPDAMVLLRPLLATSIALAIFGLRIRGPAAVLASGLAGAILVYLIQFRGWDYHLFPMAGLTCLLAATILSGTVRRDGWLIALIALFVALAPSAKGTYTPQLTYSLLSPTLRGADSALLLGENVWLAYPMVQEMNVRHVSRYPAIWTLPGAAIIAADPSHPHRAEAIAILQSTRRTLVDDFLRTPPEVLIVDERQYKPYFRGPFDYIRFLRQDARFAAALRHYRDTGKVGSFRVYRRNGRDDLS